MEFLTLFLIFGITGVLIGILQSGRKKNEYIGNTTISAKKLTSKVEGSWRTLFGGSGRGRRSFQTWATGPGARLFPDEFTNWLASLPEPAADVFSVKLADYAHGLGFSLSELMDESLDRQPILRQVFVEAIVVYSQAYRRAKQARQQAEGNKNSASEGGLKSPEKKADHHAGGSAPEASTPASAA
jgi:hypothetical protein